MYLYLFFIKAYVMGTHLNCLKANQMSTHHICFYKDSQKGIWCKRINSHLMKSSANLSLKRALIRGVFYLKVSQ